MFEPTTIVKRSERQVACNLNGEVAILDLDKGVYFGLQDVGAHVWESLQIPQSVDAIYASVLAHFDVSVELCEADVTKFLKSLQDAGMVEIVPQDVKRLHP
jgi:hypothetical protein